ncbi:UDP-2,4-diacetamido-2,4,6-trideoxy-beta-L-altropyranose hydrolase [Ornithinibacillus contaminans]|uniref:UDP-2,4-diacetamido-2,4, 6-trideoxy-beta-L-altropyranose hydrolase n=1 Tax=Ornithinibacillus contaminans TaxID=694055 RepID=UPI00064DAE28|nr:UDP-2,4-diacetamido-2,4,6-trideoxy-beta-L-altropyranose hydrolase [Ornithinibacillus contaminans]
MNILVRTDASTEIGSGHVMRCLTIADSLKKIGHLVTFWMKVLPGNLISLVEEKGYTVVQKVELSDILIVDHYCLDRKWEQDMRKYTNKIVVIDDLANRQHDCDLLLDQNVVFNYEIRYDNLVPRHCKKLLGPKYLIMRDEFILARLNNQHHSGRLDNLLVFMGGSDLTNETLKVLEALEKTKTEFSQINVVVGSSNPNKLNINEICLEKNYFFHCQINYMARLMGEADFSIGAGGLSTWERCYVGLPSSSTIIADNQLETTITAEKLGAVINLGRHEEVTINTYTELLNSLPRRKQELLRVSQKGLEITESEGQPNLWLQEIVG